MNDVEFAHNLSPQLATHYEQAKDLSLTASAYALTFLRSVEAIFCEMVELVQLVKKTLT